LIQIESRWEEEEGPQEVCSEQALYDKLGLKNRMKRRKEQEKKLVMEEGRTT
jgi:hypothetical protein